MLIIDIVIISIVYGTLYHAIKIIFKDHLQVFKVLFNITVLEQSLNRETDVRQYDHILHFLTSTIVFVILTFNSLTQSFFLLLFKAIDVGLISRLLLCKVIFVMHFEFRETRQINWTHVPACLFFLLNYSNSHTLTFLLFQLCDDFFELDRFFVQLDILASKIILGNIIPLQETIAYFKTRKQMLSRIRISFICAHIFILLWIQDDIFNFNELYFLYYAVYRFAIVYQHMTVME